jgi:hypothetical protein
MSIPVVACNTLRQDNSYKATGILYTAANMHSKTSLSVESHDEVSKN